ncbi:hypothetical protein THAOC_28582 [Thalassiosira oceanica]|uniref:Uncharacterized protein n=1 Tax=Thalassiosira oceanica TaxID=159749 RepID=K0S017_THAOC|nr:hypothetical protein THAOC_28582 [Thalassiosira oceanica]|eukprot:EJK52177.1 hypothetical protein THAOC_28582 [Thalassiosira oceanica]
MDHQQRQGPASFAAQRRRSSIRLKIPLLDLRELLQACDDVSVLEEEGYGDDDGDDDDGDGDASSIHSEEDLLHPRPAESHRTASQRTSWSESTFNTFNSMLNIDIAVEPPRELHDVDRRRSDGFHPSIQRDNGATCGSPSLDLSNRTEKRCNRPHAREVRLSQSILSNSDSRVHLDPAEVVLDLDMKIMQQNVELRAELARLKNELRHKDEELKKMEGRRRFVDNSTRIVGGLWRKATQGKQKRRPRNSIENGRVRGVKGKQNLAMSNNSFGTETTVGCDEDVFARARRL